MDRISDYILYNERIYEQMFGQLVDLTDPLSAVRRTVEVHRT